MIYGIELGTRDVLKILHYQNFLRNIGLITKIKPNMTEADFARAMLSGRKKANYKKLEEVIKKDHEYVTFKASGMTFIAGVPKEKLDEGMTKEEAADIIIQALAPITNKYFSDVWAKEKMTFIDA